MPLHRACAPAFALVVMVCSGACIVPAPASGPPRAADATPSPSPALSPATEPPSDEPAAAAVVTPAAAAGASLGEGLASYYARALVGRRTASGELYDSAAMTAAHPQLPFGSCVRVVHVASGRSVEVRINDRGPFRGGRIIDLSEAAASQLGMLAEGLTRVHLYACDRVE